MTARLGSLDRRIVAALQAEPRASWAAVATVARTTETTAARRASRLLETGALRLTGLADPIRCGFGQPVLLQLKCEPSRAGSIADALARREDVRFCGLTTGRWDVVAELISSSSDDLARVVVDEVGQLPGITESSTAFVTRNYKMSYDWSRGLLDVASDDVPLETEGGAAASTRWHDPSASAAVDLDDVDVHLLAAVADNGRRSYAEVAGEVGLSETAVRRRLERLVRERCLIFSAYVEPAALGYHLEFLVWLRMSYRHLDRAAAELAAHREVRYLSATAGSAELVCEVVLPEQGDLYAFTTEVLGRLPGLVTADIGVEIGNRKRAWHGPADQPGASPTRKASSACT
ncbi:MAG TPA: Lrp/AsnC family transcriptional regulator [Nocardioidaceae bacterium]|nr:Lrp/AsnC family transcriptional regulator [Nocardioidaceae bacterium]